MGGEVSGVGMFEFRQPLKRVSCFAMTHAQKPPKTIGKLIDEVERIREDLFCLQRELEKIEIVETTLSGDERK
jgi:hypothetical protein